MDQSRAFDSTKKLNADYSKIILQNDEIEEEFDEDMATNQPIDPSLMKKVDKIDLQSDHQEEANMIEPHDYNASLENL